MSWPGQQSGQNVYVRGYGLEEADKSNKIQVCCANVQFKYQGTPTSNLKGYYTG